MVMEKVAGHFGIDTESLKSVSRAPAMANARAVLCHLGLHKIGLPSGPIANELGISQSAVSRAIARAPEALQGEDIEGQLKECQKIKNVPLSPGCKGHAALAGSLVTPFRVPWRWRRLQVHFTLFAVPCYLAS